MDYYALSNLAAAAEIGRRIEQRRLERNLTQQQLADELGITAKSYRQLIAGGGKFENIIGALRVLECLEGLDALIPDTPFSPIEQLKLRGKQRKRASGARAATSTADKNELDW